MRYARFFRSLLALGFLCWTSSRAQIIDLDLDLLFKIESPASVSGGIYASYAGQYVTQLGDFNGDGLDD